MAQRLRAPVLGVQAALQQQSSSGGAPCSFLKPGASQHTVDSRSDLPALQSWLCTPLKQGGCSRLGREAGAQHGEGQPELLAEAQCPAAAAGIFAPCRIPLKV